MSTVRTRNGLRELVTAPPMQKERRVKTSPSAKERIDNSRKTISFAIGGALVVIAGGVATIIAAGKGGGDKQLDAQLEKKGAAVVPADSDTTGSVLVASRTPSSKTPEAIPATGGGPDDDPETTYGWDNASEYFKFIHAKALRAYKAGGLTYAGSIQSSVPDHENWTLELHVANHIYEDESGVRQRIPIVLGVGKNSNLKGLTPDELGLVVFRGPLEGKTMQEHLQAFEEKYGNRDLNKESREHLKGKLAEAGGESVPPMGAKELDAAVASIPGVTFEAYNNLVTASLDVDIANGTDFSPEIMDFLLDEANKGVEIGTAYRRFLAHYSRYAKGHPRMERALKAAEQQISNVKKVARR